METEAIEVEVCISNQDGELGDLYQENHKNVLINDRFQKTVT